MPKRTDIKTILVIGSGPIVIGQACEFDYSGTQAVKALKEEGYRVVLINSNPATIMTDPNLADQTYIEPITADFIEKIIQKEKPEVILPTIGGQTALNAAIELEEKGILKKYNVELIGAKVDAIKKAEDRDSFKQAVERCGLESAKSILARNLEEAWKAAEEIGFPLIIRPSRTLGGSGGGIVERREDFEDKVNFGFECSPINELLIEESLVGWKEIELEVMRDNADNAVIICGIENVDPMGLHTGDSITVAPIQTLTDKEYQSLRDGAISLLREIGVETGGSNVQFTICPKTGRQIVIEMNPRVSRSSALASKATGFPIAKIAAKLAIGYTLDELPNDITKKTPACFEPSIDYVVVKIPRFTFEKFKDAEIVLGTQMKSVGEAMAMGRTFNEALQKACRSLEDGRVGILGGPESQETDLPKLLEKIKSLNPQRIYQVARALELGATTEEIFEISGFDKWFLSEINKIIELESSIKNLKLSELSAENLKELKKNGFADIRIAQLLGVSEREVSLYRRSLNVRPSFKRVDTCAAEFDSSTPYLYSTYDDYPDALPTKNKKIIILGGGPNRIGQGLEFDYCCVHATFALREAGYETIMVNCNPETVSTDYDISDRLYFEPLTLEDVEEIIENENPYGIIVQYGGQTPLKLSQALAKNNRPIIGTSASAIELSEDREQFKALLDRLGLKQSASGTAINRQQAFEVAEQIGFPLLIRPSFVLGGRAMAIIANTSELEKYLEDNFPTGFGLLSFDRPVLLDRFLDNAVEVDVDAVCDGKKVVVAGVIEHIERAGIHSGDSSFILPSQNLTPRIILEIEKAAKALAKECQVCGLMNIQFAVCEEEIFVIEVNPRASRSVPFVSKVTGVPWAKIAARVMAGESLEELQQCGLYGNILIYENYLEGISQVNYVAVKESVFPFVKFRGADALLGPEMRSTGEVMGIDKNFPISFYKAQLAAGTRLPLEGTVFVSVKDSDKDDTLQIAKSLVRLGFKIVATKGTTQFLAEHGLNVSEVKKVRDGSPNVVDLIKRGEVAMIINSPEGTGTLLDSRSIRTTAIELSLPLFTTIQAAEAAVTAIEQIKQGYQPQVTSIQDYLDF